MTSTKIVLGPKAAGVFAAYVNNGKALVDLKELCKRHGSFTLGQAEFDFAMAHGMDKLIASGVLKMEGGMVKYGVVPMTPDKKMDPKKTIVSPEPEKVEEPVSAVPLFEEPATPAPEAPKRRGRRTEVEGN